VIEMMSNVSLLSTQRARFLLDPDGPVEVANIETRADYDVTTWYARIGYSKETAIGEVAPYGQWDYYQNKETIKSKSYGGDNEAGASEDGTFHKSTLGIIYRPITQVAVKLDQSYHFFKLNGKDVNYPEIRLDVSFTFGL